MRLATIAGMPELSRSQMLVYAAIAVAVLLVGARWLRSDADPERGRVVDALGAAGAGSFEVEHGGEGLVVHVAGEVRDPGVYRLPQGSRVTDAIERAGGATSQALPDGLNLAAELADGQQVVLPSRSPTAGSPAGSAATEGPISLGTATVEQLDTIEGIGPVTAEDILEFRDEHGGVGSIEQLDEISGIGPATMEALERASRPEPDRSPAPRRERSTTRHRLAVRRARRGDDGAGRIPLVPRTGGGGALIAAAALAVALLIVTRPREPARLGPAAVWLAALALALTTAGRRGLGALAAIDAGALDPAGGEVVARGFVTSVPTRSAGEVGVRVETPDGRLEVRAPEPVADLAVGSAVRAVGRLREPGDWERARLARLGIRAVLATEEIETVPGARTGITGVLDGVRARAEAALGEGTGADEASLLRGFVLGQDDRIDEATVDEFKASGLAHLLAVSGQNVVLLAVLAAALLAVLDVPLRARLAWILVLIAIYVPVAGAGPSIQRAGVMGAAGIVAALAGRARSRWYALLLAACATLGLDPRASADIGWQLSFAAVAGILLASALLATAIAGDARAGAGRSQTRSRSPSRPRSRPRP